MPPVQCPECGRFLKHAFVVGLSDAPAPCPGCDVELGPELFDGTDALEGVAASTEVAGAADGATSVRPPDLEPQRVRDQPPDVLSGWDSGVGPGLDAGALDRAPFPTDVVVVAASGLAGLVLGAALGRERRTSAAAAGAAVGILGASVARRIWRLEV